ncbi:hypothetical protein [Haladaptatus pallidirubidus]|uniref:Uncharacterized protein n=1 Tax=Haladaptatus pallidirubidus TaxID=1008152 RepID=A0AAV3ULI2_9EURY|nr:hypothetical protein [Haladaptatus pallidirubidus]
MTSTFTLAPSTTELSPRDTESDSRRGGDERDGNHHADQHRPCATHETENARGTRTERQQ